MHILIKYNNAEQQKPSNFGPLNFGIILIDQEQILQSCLADPNGARGCFTNSLVINSLIHSVRKTFSPTALQRRHAQTVRDRCSSYNINYVVVIKNFLNPKGYQNPISGSKVTTILLKWRILPIGGASAGEILRLQPAQQACLVIMSPPVFNRPGVAGAVL